jgi:hypothetical protein
MRPHSFCARRYPLRHLLPKPAWAEFPEPSPIPQTRRFFDAKVTVTNVDTRATRTAATDSNGSYIVTNLPIGNYTLEVARQGFKTASHSGVMLSADARVTVDFGLEIGNLSQTVEVTAVQTEQVNAVSGEVSRVIDSKQVDNLTMNGRNYVQLMTMVPGAIVTNPDQFSTTTSLASNNQTINGNRADSNNLTVDGAYNSVAGSNSSLVNNVSPDFIQEVKLQTSNFSAEYGRFSGPAFNIITKSGNNQFHGGAFEFFRNNDLDARSFFAAQDRCGSAFGYDVGSPIKKDSFLLRGEVEAPAPAAEPHPRNGAHHRAARRRFHRPGTALSPRHEDAHPGQQYRSHDDHRWQGHRQCL